LFAVKDFAKITLRDIQKASGFDAALIYYYFKDKQDLFNAAVKFALAEALDSKEHFRTAQHGPVEAIKGWLQHCLSLAEENRTIMRVMVHHAGSPTGPKGFDDLVQEFYLGEETYILARAIERGIATGVFRKVHVQRVARYVSVHLDGITAASIVRREFDIAAAFRDLEATLWLQLGYEPNRLSPRQLELRAAD
jgi:AcrR family transcriptional regulator